MIFDKYDKRGAYHYDWYGKDMDYTECIDVTLDLIKGSGIILDLGCGDGLLERNIDATYPEKTVVGIDSSASGIAFAIAKNEKGLFLHGEFNIIDNLLYDFDCLVCINTIEHLEDAYQILDIFRRRIKSKAIIITDIPAETPGKYHTKEYSPGELQRMFSDYHTERIPMNSKIYHGIEVWK
jgi:2-polyprenyl-3-methyl-5-hydroxy-6-metoxy-1,4-benzoquinol methylase